MTGPAAHAPIDCDGLGDDALLALARDGHPEAFRVIMQHANQRLFRMARAVMRDDDEAEDVLQESYLRAFANLARFGVARWHFRRFLRAPARVKG